MIEGYAEHGEFTRKGLKAFVDRLDSVGLKIERANSLGPFYLNAHLARPEGQKEIDRLKRMAELLVDFEIPVYGIQACQARLHLAKDSDRWIRRRGRGGYRFLHFAHGRLSINPFPNLFRLGMNTKHSGKVQEHLGGFRENERTDHSRPSDSAFLK